MKKVFDRKGVFAKSLSVWSAFAAVATTTAPAFAGTAVLGGSAELANLTRVTMDKNGANEAVFSSTAASGVLDWTKFNVGSGQSMSFNGSGTTFFNLVDGAAGKSQIDGIINGSGNVWVINPAGIAFGANASVNVGGLFAAAAGNLENAAALRDGTATTPSFSSFAGTVDTSKGSFTADQVALMGKTVTTAGGDFSGAKVLSVAASTGAMTVDEVEGGKVLVNIGDFAADDASVIVGELNVDGDLSIRSTGVIGNIGDVALRGNDVELVGSLVSMQGGVSVKASGSLDVDADVSAPGTVAMSTKNGNITVEQGRTVASVGDYGSVVMESGAAENGSGDIVINGSVYALSDYGTVSLMSAQGSESTGNVVVNGIVDSDVETTLGAGYSVSTDATGGHGAVSIGSSGAVAAEYGTTYLVASGRGEDGVSVDGNVCGPYGVIAMANAGDVSLNDGAEVVAGLKSAGGGLAYAGTLSVTARDGNVSVGKAELLAGNAGVMARKDVTVNGCVDAQSITLQSSEGGVRIGGTVSAQGTAAVEYRDPTVNAIQVSAGGAGEKVSISETGVVLAKEGSVTLVGENGVSSSGSIAAMNGYLNVNGKAGDVNLNENGTGLVVAGDVQAVSTKDVIVNNPRNIIDTDVEICKAYSEYFGAQNVDFKDDPSGLAVDDWMYEQHYSRFGFLSWDGNVVVCGDIAANNGPVAIQSRGDLTLLSGTSIQSSGVVVLDAGEDALVGSRIKSGGNVTISAGGDIVQPDFSGVVTPQGSLATFTSSSGDVAMNAKANDFGGFVRAEGESVEISDLNNIMLGQIVARTGDVTVKSHSGDLVVAQGAEVDAAGKVSLLAGQIACNLGEVKGNEAAMFAVGNVLNGGVINVGGGKFDATAETGEVLSDAGASVLAGDVTLKAGTSIQMLGPNNHVGGRLEADGASVTVIGTDGLRLGNVIGDDSVEVWTTTGDITVDSSARVASDGQITLMSAAEQGSSGDVRVEGSIVSSHGDVSLATYYNGDIFVVKGASVRAEIGEMSLSTAGKEGCAGNIVVDGEAFGGSYVAIGSGMGVGSRGDVRIGGSGEIVSQGNVDIWGGGAGGDVIVNGSVSSLGEGENATVAIGTAFEENAVGNIVINGAVRADDVSGDQGYVQLWAGVSPNSSGNISFGRNGNASAECMVDVIARNGNVSQDEATIDIGNGYAQYALLPSSLTASFVQFNVNGNIGSGVREYVAIDGVVLGYAKGDASVAAANGGAFLGGDNDSSYKPTISRNGQSITVDWGSDIPNSTLVADGDLSIYTARGLDPYGLLVAGRNLTVSAASFGDMSYLQAGGKLTINNVGRPSHPQIAYFESVDGREPRINNQPNDVVIFVDGRLAGGNLNILNKFGADEAFMVETPELKSTQGIFGNPPFLHSDLDVANPMEVSAIDYLIQEVPRLTLSSDFPAEVDQNVEAIGLSQKDVYWFGQKGVDEKKAGEAPDKNRADREEKNQGAADKTVAFVK